MSFSVTIKGKPAEVVEKVGGELTLPEGVKAFIVAGANALESRYGADREVTVSAHGHLHDGSEGNHDVSGATIQVAPAEIPSGSAEA